MDSARTILSRAPSPAPPTHAANFRTPHSDPSRVQLLWQVLASDLNFALRFPGLRKIVARLQAYPCIRGTAEDLRQPDRHFGADSGPAVDDFGEGLPAQAPEFSRPP